MNDDDNSKANKPSATDEVLEKTKQQAKEAFKVTQEQTAEALKVTAQQTEEAARQLGSFLKFGAAKLKKAADAAADAIREDINKRP